MEISEIVKNWSDLEKKIIPAVKQKLIRDGEPLNTIGDIDSGSVIVCSGGCHVVLRWDTSQVVMDVEGVEEVLEAAEDTPAEDAPMDTLTKAIMGLDIPVMVVKGDGTILKNANFDQEAEDSKVVPFDKALQDIIDKIPKPNIWSRPKGSKFD